MVKWAVIRGEEGHFLLKKGALKRDKKGALV